MCHVHPYQTIVTPLIWIVKLTDTKAPCSFSLFCIYYGADTRSADFANHLRLVLDLNKCPTIVLAVQVIKLYLWEVDMEAVLSALFQLMLGDSNLEAFFRFFYM